MTALVVGVFIFDCVAACVVAAIYIRHTGRRAGPVVVVQSPRLDPKRLGEVIALDETQREAS